MKTPIDVEILLVEDNQDHARFILSALKEDNGLETSWAKDGEEALAYLRQRRATEPDRPLVVLLDIHIPKLSGREVLREIRRDDTLLSIPVVMLTTSDRKEEITAAYRAGANGYVTKPLKLREFVEKIKSVKQYWTFTSEIPAA